MSICKFYESVSEIDKLIVEVRLLLNNLQTGETQIMCQNTVPDQDNWSAGAGRISDLDNQDEKSYKYINPSLKGSIIEKYIIKYNAFRTRIMIMPGRKSYSVHRDPTPRIHIPIITIPGQAWMIWPHNNVCQQLKVGNIYWTDTTLPHTFLNGAETERIHIVMGVNS